MKKMYQTSQSQNKRTGRPFPHDYSGSRRKGQGAFLKRAVKLEEIPINAVIGTREVWDPYESATRMTAPVSIRDDPLGRLFARNQISEPLFEAGRYWQAMYEASMIGRVRGMDPTKEPVDGTPVYPEPITDRHKKAVKWLEAIARELGSAGDEVIFMVLGNRIFINDMVVSLGYVDIYGKPQQRAVDYYSRRLRECLETIAKFCGYAT